MQDEDKDKNKVPKSTDISAKMSKASAKAAAPPHPSTNRPSSDLIKTLAKFLFRCPSLTSLSVIGLALSNTDLRTLGRALSMNSKVNLTSINFVRVPMGDGGLSELSPALCGSGAASISVVDCNVSDYGGEYVASIIRSHGARRDEAIWSAGLRGEPVRAHGDRCPRHIPEMGALVLDFSNNRLADNAAEVIGEVGCLGGRG